MALRAAVLLLAVVSLASKDQAFRKVQLKLIAGRDAASAEFGYLYYLVEHEPILGSCRWARALLVGEELLKSAGMQSAEQMRAVRRCGRSSSFACSFYDSATIAESSLADVFRLKVRRRYDAFLIGDYWTESEQGCPDWIQQDQDAYLEIPLPGQVSRARVSWEDWLARQLLHTQLEAEVAEGKGGNLLQRTVNAIPQICTNSVTDVWDSLWPGALTAKGMLVIGSSSLEGEPTQPLLDKGAGGLFIDRDVRAIRKAKRTVAASNRRFLNTTVRPRDIGSLLAEHASFLPEVEVVQVDVDTVDAPIVQAILDHVHPRAVVVEVRDVVPFPFRYTCLTQDTKGVALGGANLAFWLHELQRRGYQLARLDHRDAVFVREEEAPPSADRFLGTLGCYMLHYMMPVEPPQLLQKEAHGMVRFRWHWLESEPEDVIDEIWLNLTAWRSDVRFILDG